MFWPPAKLNPFPYFITQLWAASGSTAALCAFPRVLSGRTLCLPGIGLVRSDFFCALKPLPAILSTWATLHWALMTSSPAQTLAI